MARTLEDLFKTKPLESQDGRTAQDAYGIRDSKKIRISSNNILLDNTGFTAARTIRKTGIGRTSETALEQELTGIRIIRAASEPVLYGNETFRITLRSTPTLDMIKGDGGTGGLIGGRIQSLRNSANSKLGIPMVTIPTYVKNELSDPSKYDLSITQNRMEDLAKIRNSGEGTIVGRFLKNTGGGTPSTIGKQALGSFINLTKDRVRGVLFGTRSTTPFRNATVNRSGTNITFNYGALDEPGTITSFPDGTVDAAGTRYSKTITLRTSDRQGTGVSFINDEDAILDGGLVAKTPTLDIDTTNMFSRSPERVPKFTDKAKVFDYNKNDFMETSRGMYSNYDVLNRNLPYRPNEARGSIKPQGLDKTLEDLDFVPLRFELIHGGSRQTTVNFRATITGLQESFNPSWDSGKFIGSPFSYYTYSGIERSLSFSFKVYSLDADEHKAAWQRLNFLTGLVYPSGYHGDGYAIIAPFIYFTLGDLYRHREAFIESLTYSYNDESPWQIANKEKTAMRTAVNLASQFTTGITSEETVDMVGYRLPMIIDVSTTIKILQTRSNTNAKRFYTFNVQT